MIPPSQGVQAWDRYAYVNNSPVNFNDMNGHHVVCDAQEDCNEAQSLARYNGEQYEQYLTAQIKYEFGVIISNANRHWDFKNLNIVYSSLNIIDTNSKINGNLKSDIRGATFTLSYYKPLGPDDSGQYYSITYHDTFTIDFQTLNDSVYIRQMNIYHEVAHLLDKGNYWISNSLDQIKNPTFLTADRKNINVEALINQNYVYDMTYNTAQTIMHKNSTDRGEQWADSFANFIAENIDLSNQAGKDMNKFVTDTISKLY